MNEPKARQRDTVIAVPLSLTDITKAFRELIALIKDASGLVSDCRKIYTTGAPAKLGAMSISWHLGLRGRGGTLRKSHRVHGHLKTSTQSARAWRKPLETFEEAIGWLAQFRDALREKYGMGTAALLDELLYGPSGKQAIRYTLLDMVHAARRPGARPEDIQASAHQALGLVQASNTQLVSLHDQILRLSRERA